MEAILQDSTEEGTIARCSFSSRSIASFAIDDPHQRVYQTADLFANGIKEVVRDARCESQAGILEQRTFVGSSKSYGMLGKTPCEVPLFPLLCAPTIFFEHIWEHLGQRSLQCFTYEKALKSTWAQMRVFVRRLM